MYITRIDSYRDERIVARNILSREQGIKQIVSLAREEAKRIPNDPHIDQSGPDEVSIYIACSRITSFRLDQTHDEAVMYYI